LVYKCKGKAGPHYRTRNKNGLAWIFGGAVLVSKIGDLQDCSYELAGFGEAYD
jgi:hypothetical protein